MSAASPVLKGGSFLNHGPHPGRHQYRSSNNDVSLPLKSYADLIRGPGRYGISDRNCRVIPALMLAALITLLHFSVSSAMSFPNSAGDPAWMRNPRSSYLALISGRARDALISLLSTSTISARI